MFSPISERQKKLTFLLERQIFFFHYLFPCRLSSRDCEAPQLKHQGQPYKFSLTTTPSNLYIIGINPILYFKYIQNPHRHTQRFSNRLLFPFSCLKSCHLFSFFLLQTTHPISPGTIPLREKVGPGSLEERSLVLVFLLYC